MSGKKISSRSSPTIDVCRWCRDTPTISNAVITGPPNRARIRLPTAGSLGNAILASCSSTTTGTTSELKAVCAATSCCGVAFGGGGAGGFGKSASTNERPATILVFIVSK